MMKMCTNSHSQMYSSLYIILQMVRFCKINHRILASPIVQLTLSLPKTLFEKKVGQCNLRRGQITIGLRNKVFLGTVIRVLARYAELEQVFEKKNRIQIRLFSRAESVTVFVWSYESVSPVQDPNAKHLVISTGGYILPGGAFRDLSSH